MADARPKPWPQNCPNCGHKPCFQHQGDRKYAYCDACGLRGPWSIDVKAATTLWDHIRIMHSCDLPDGTFTVEASGITMTAEPLSLRAVTDTLAGLIPEGMQVIVTGKAKE